MAMGQGKLFKRNSFLQKMLFSILGLICIPLICIQLVMIIHSNREFRRETTTHNQYALASLAAAFDSQLGELSNTMYRMCIDTEISRFISEEVSGYPLAQTAVKVNRYVLDSPLLSSVGVYHVEKDVILHNESKRSVEHICDDFFVTGSQGSACLADFLRNTDTLDYFYTENYEGAKRKCLIIAKAFSIGSLSDRDMVVFFIMDEASFRRWSAMFVPTGESFAILDPEGNYLFRGDDFSEALVETAAFQSFLADREAAYVPKDDSGLIVYKCHDISAGFTFLVSMVKQTAEENFAKYTSQAAFSVAVTVVLTVILLSVTLYINYKPVSRLMQKHFQHAHGTTELSELELIDSHFFALDERLNDQSRLLATFIMGDLLSGIQVEKGTLEKHFPSDIYRNFAAAVSRTPLTAAQSRALCQLFPDVLPGKLVVTSVPYRTEMVFVYASEGRIDLPLLKARLIQALCSVTGQMHSVSTGTAVVDIGAVQDSYNHALLTEGAAGEADYTKPEEYPRTLLAEFLLHTGNGNWDKALQTLDKLQPATQALKPPVKRFLQLKVLSGFLTSVQKGGNSISERETDRLLSFTNSQQLYSMLRNLISDLRDAAQDPGKTTPSELRKRLLQYVDENYCSSELCLTSAADYLKTSVYTVSRVFKELTGYGFKEYISEKRLQQASRLLQESDLSVTDIAAACGFENVNYFTSIFRLKYGTPPSKYRKELSHRLRPDDLPDDP